MGTETKPKAKTASAGSDAGAGPVVDLIVEPVRRPPARSATVTIVGDLEHDNTADFLADVDDAFGSAAAGPGLGLELLVIDCSRLTFCDSSGLSALLMTHRRASAQGTRLVLAAQPPMLRDLLELTGTSTMFEGTEQVRADYEEPAEGTTAMRRSANVRRLDGHQVVELAGEIDLEFADEVRVALNTAAIGAVAAAPTAPGIIIDVSGLVFADSTMLHLLMQARKHVEVNLAGPLAPGVQLLLEVAGVAELFPLYPSVREAVLAVERSAQWKPVP